MTGVPVSGRPPLEGDYSMLENTSDSLYVRLLIWDRFPEFRGIVLELEKDERELIGGNQEFEVGSYSYISEAFMDKILLPSLGSRDTATLMKASQTVEDLLECGRDSVVEMVNIRIVDYLLGFPERWFEFREFVGPNLAEQVSLRGIYFNFNPFPEGS
ncbi:hypothetical protein [Streptomyces zaomyceticus]|uniref:hypothetical protein n=1 Tax=Streptomyces zaomyceticus TaxID=68286 RepID=UPI003428CFB0